MTVLVCTRDRGDSIVITIRSILACAYPRFTLVIVDQSSDLCTEQAISAFCGDPRLRYIHTSARGKSHAENIGLAFTAADIVLLTDDDCEVPPNWINAMVEPFLRYPRVGMVFCNVIAAPHDSYLGGIPVNINPRSLLITDLAHWQTSDGVNIGIGAGMAVRRATAEAISGFSPLFGPGSRFRSGDDTDFTLRALAAGYQIYRTNTAEVIHHGFRTYEEWRRLIRNNAFGLGGVNGQLLRLGHWFALRNYVAIFSTVVIKPALHEVIHLRPPHMLGRAIWLIRGMAEGLCLSPPRRQGGVVDTKDGDHFLICSEKEYAAGSS
ncbi:MAG: glycosyltransferase [Chloroflexales bacterium]